jgi:hypothetical protein
MRDQPAFNLLTHEGVGGHSLTPAVRFKDVAKKGSEGHRMVYYAANATLRLGVLPNWLFGSGHTYFVQQHHLSHPEDGAPFSVHMTYQYGDTGSYAFGKRERMRQAGLWRADDDTWFGGNGDTKGVTRKEEKEEKEQEEQRSFSRSPTRARRWRFRLRVKSGSTTGRIKRLSGGTSRRTV